MQYIFAELISKKIEPDMLISSIKNARFCAIVEKKETRNRDILYTIEFPGNKTSKVIQKSVDEGELITFIMRRKY